MKKRWQSRKRKTLPFEGNTTISLFILLATFAVVGRILQLDLITTKLCHAVFFRGESPSSATISFVEWIIIIAVLALAAQLLLAMNGVVQKSIRKLSLLLGIVNVLLASTLMVGWSQVWAWWHSDEPLGRTITELSMNSGLGRLKLIGLSDSFRRSYDDDEYWTQIGLNEFAHTIYQHKATGVTVSDEVVFSCLPDELFQTNIRILIETGRLKDWDFEKRPNDQVTSRVFRDPEGVFVYAPFYFSYDPTGLKFREEQRTAKPSIDAKEFFYISNEEALQNQKLEEDLSLDEFTRRYVCILERERTGQFKVC